ncbi:MAG: penicillin-binding protein activator [Sphingobium sp.]|nr:penicillin-binding protein activator [Sphingobium sp.]MCP5400188.1 penicillin-binding protein activator [Sphingomonas sp.]
MAETGAIRQADIWNIVRRAGRAVMLGSALFLAACQTIVPKSTGPGTTGPAQPAPVQPGLPTDETRHRIALLVPLSGSNAGVGKSISNATTMALLDTAATNVRVTTYDTGRGSAAAASKAIADGNRLILGPLTGDEVKAAAPYARKAGVPIISFSNDASVAGNGVYIMGYSPAQSVERVVSFAKSKGISNFAALVPTGVYGERTGNAMLQAVRKSGGTVVSMQNYDRNALSIKAAIGKLAEGSEYQAVLIADGGRVAMQAAPMLRQNGGAAARILGTELWNTESELAGSAALNGAWFASVSDAYYRQLASKYRKRFGTAPYRLSALGYDAVLLTVKIAQQDWKPGRAFPTGALTDKGGFAGIDGAFRFGRDGVAERALEVQQIGNGKFSVIDAAPGGF